MDPSDVDFKRSRDFWGLALVWGLTCLLLVDVCCLPVGSQAEENRLVIQTCWVV